MARMIDNAKASGHNAVTAMAETVATASFDTPLQILRRLRALHGPLHRLSAFLVQFALFMVLFIVCPCCLVQRTLRMPTGRFMSLWLINASPLSRVVSRRSWVPAYSAAYCPAYSPAWPLQSCSC
eukprot:4966182-Amphidinium_carterae.1